MGKLNDLDYCYASIVLLEELEKVSYARNERLRQFHEKVHARQSFVAAALAMILPVIVWIYLLTANCKSKLATQINLYRRAVIKHFSWIVIHPNFNLSDLFRGRF
ncbi:MAG: hypothetical protein PHR41_03595, partial [Lactococcus chungangensis]|nr:hypothetical protein [Lactococcus chungangensis]